MIYWYGMYLATAFIFIVPVIGFAQQPLPSCIEQLAEIQTTLAFVRGSRQMIEENAGRVTATLQHQLDTIRQEYEKTKKEQAVGQKKEHENGETVPGDKP